MSASDAAIRIPSMRAHHEPTLLDGTGAPGVLSAGDVTARIFWAFIGVHVILWTVMPAMTHPNRPLDMVEMLYWGHGWQWGYYKHPPLPAWIAAAIFEISAGAVWPLYLVAQLAVATSFWAAWKLAQEFLKPWPALCASLLLETCSYYNLATADINNSIILQPCWALSVLFLYRGITTKKLGYWAALGASLGLGMLAKYDMAVLVLAMIYLAARSETARLALCTAGPYVACFVSLAIFFPHLAWMIQNQFPSVQYALQRADHSRSSIGHLVNPLEFLISQILALLPMLAIAYPLWRRRGRQPAEANELDTFQQDFLLVLVLGPLALDLLVSLCTGAKLQSMWGMRMWSFSGLLLIHYASAAIEPRVYRTVIARCALAGCLIVAAVTARSVALPFMRSKPSRIHYPGVQLAEVVERQWQQHTDRPLTIVAGPWWPAANASLYLHSRPLVHDVLNPEFSPWSNDAALRREGGMIVWEKDVDGAICAQEVRRRFPEAEILAPFELNWQTKANFPPVQFGAAIVRPSVAAENAASGRNTRR